MPFWAWILVGVGVWIGFVALILFEVSRVPPHKNVISEEEWHEILRFWHAHREGKASSIRSMIEGRE